jgi:putative lipoic acid-binding regulatory protein
VSDDAQRLRELLESTHTFPGPYSFKVIFRNQTAAGESILAALAAGTGLAVRTDADSIKVSAQGSYVSMTVLLDADTSQDVLSVYAVLGTLKSVLQYF